MRTSLLLALLFAGQALAAKIPNHPDKLVYDELHYDPPVAADYREPLAEGAVAYIAEDSRVPLIDITINIKMDDQQVPEGMNGLHEATMELLTAGAGDWDATWIEEEIAYLGASLRSRVTSSGGRVRLQTLTKDFDHGLDMLFAILQTPNFDQDRLELWKEERIASFKERNDHPRRIESMEWRRLIYDESWYKPATAADVDAINRDAMKEWARTWIQPAHMVIAISGDFQTEEMLAKLNRRLAGWSGPEVSFGAMEPVYSDVSPGVYLINKDVNQTRAICLLPGLDRDSDSWLAAYMMNEILGGSGMSSNLVNRIRTKEGLAYSTGSRLEEVDRGQGLLYALFQTKTESTIFAMSLLVDEYNKMAAGDIDEESFENARTKMIDGFPATFGDAARIVSVLADEEITGRYESNPLYYSELRDKARALTLQDLKAAAAELLRSDQLVWLLVGDAEEILKGDEEHGLTLDDIAPVTRLPLRDPLTQEPIAER